MVKNKSHRARKGIRCSSCGRVQRRDARRKVGQSQPKRRSVWTPDSKPCQFVGC